MPETAFDHKHVIQSTELLQVAATPHSSPNEIVAWSAEPYEKATVASVDWAFMKFTKRLTREPDQCIRLGYAFQR